MIWWYCCSSVGFDYFKCFFFFCLKITIPVAGRPSEKPQPTKIYSSAHSLSSPSRQGSHSPQGRPTNSPQSHSQSNRSLSKQYSTQSSNHAQYESHNRQVSQVKLHPNHLIRQSKSWQEDRRRGSSDSSGSSSKVTFSLGDNPVNKADVTNHNRDRHRPASRPDSGVVVTPSPDVTDMSGPWTVVDRTKVAPSPPRNGNNTYFNNRGRAGYRGGRGGRGSRYYRSGGVSRWSCLCCSPTW